MYDIGRLVERVIQIEDELMNETDAGKSIELREERRRLKDEMLEIKINQLKDAGI